MKSATLQLETLTCPSCSAKIEGAVKTLEGIDKESLSVSFNSSKVKVNFDESKTSLEDIQAVITRVGYEVLKAKVK